MATTVYTAIIEKEGDLYAALCPELDVASQGATVEDATCNLREAIELLLECADADEIERRHRADVFVTRIEAKHRSSAMCADAEAISSCAEARCPSCAQASP